MERVGGGRGRERERGGGGRGERDGGRNGGGGKKEYTTITYGYTMPFKLLLLYRYYVVVSTVQIAC